MPAPPMAPFLYRCPRTGQNVQGWIADDPGEPDDDAYEAMQCIACSRIHMVNPASGRVLGEDKD